MNDQRLRLDLTALADEVTSVDLRDRTLRTSRRLGIQRAVATSAAALVLIAAAAGTAFAIRPDQSPTPLPADTPSVTATPTPTPTPTPSTSAGDTPGAPPSGGTGTNTPSVQFGKLFYGPASVTDAKMVNLRSWRPGDSPVRLLALPEPAALGNASISPDGRRVAWVDRDDSGESTLVVADADGSDRQEMRSHVAGDCAPVWSPDGRHLLFVEAATATGEPVRRGVLDTRSGKRTVTWWPGQARGCHALWSADGRSIAEAVYIGVTLYATDGTKKRTVPGFSIRGLRSHDIASLSSDGSRIALLLRKPNEDSGDIARELWANAVLDTRSGKQVALPLGGRTLRQVYFQSDDSMVVRVQSGSGYAVLLVDKDGRKVSETAEPASLKDEQILAVVD
ncbi:TolB family protein [Micromonospora noduli]|uniref:TolB family protein n=1 Tax=Micromonospora noduli TaxID=709876 RepID=UPI000DBF9FAB|nr:PD40 domain-containing protein [Micromonospora noduli]RAO08535.1 Beta-N-acetylhexosaminidase [Micromonospora noduli]